MTMHLATIQHSKGTPKEDVTEHREKGINVYDDYVEQREGGGKISLVDGCALLGLLLNAYSCCRGLVYVKEGGDSLKQK